MRIGIAVDYGKYANASSLNLIARKVFLELGKIMNQKKTFTITAIKYEDIGVGDVNQHFDCILVPNMGGYRFPHQGTLYSKNLIVGIVGIDEVVLGEQVYRTKRDWTINKPIIEKEVSKWEKYSDKIKFVHVSTNSDKEQLIKYLKVPENKIIIIPLGVDHERFRPPINKEEARRKILGKFFMKDSPYFIHISETNWARKNVFRMLDAFKNAKDEGVKHNLIIIGKADPIVYEKARSIPGVTILGYVSDEHLVSFLQGADALILPSLHEGFGLPLVEAMACGVPVVASNTFSPPEVADKAGLFVNPYDISDITNKIIEISKNKKLRETLSDNAQIRSQEFSWQNMANNLLKLIEKISDESSSFNFDEDINRAAYRTMTTICEIIPELANTARQDLLECNYSRIIPWSLESGLENPFSREFLIPFKDWLKSHSN